MTSNLAWNLDKHFDFCLALAPFVSTTVLTQIHTRLYLLPGDLLPRLGECLHDRWHTWTIRQMAHAQSSHSQVSHPQRWIVGLHARQDRH